MVYSNIGAEQSSPPLIETWHQGYAAALEAAGPHVHRQQIAYLRRTYGYARFEQPKHPYRVGDPDPTSDLSPPARYCLAQSPDLYPYLCVWEREHPAEPGAPHVAVEDGKIVAVWTGERP